MESIPAESRTWSGISLSHLPSPTVEDPDRALRPEKNFKRIVKEEIKLSIFRWHKGTQRKSKEDINYSNK